MRLTLVSMLLGTALGIHHGQPTATSSTKYNNLTVAIVRAPPANWPLPVMNKNWTDVKFDLNQTVVKATHLIEDAANAGANLIVFPELWFPGYVLFPRHGRLCKILILAPYSLGIPKASQTAHP